MKAKWAKWTVIVIAIIEIIAVIAIIYDYISFTVVPDDDLVEEPIEEPCDVPSGTSCTRWWVAEASMGDLMLWIF